MWNCGKCGCKAIAASLARCPMCFEETVMGAVLHSASNRGGATRQQFRLQKPASPVKAPPAEDEQETAADAKEA